MLNSFVVLDVETTGLSPARHRLVEVAALRIEQGMPGGHLATLVDPGVPIPAEATAIHGLGDPDVAGAPSEAEAARLFLDFLGGPDTLVVAHNAQFDSSFLAHALMRSGVDLPGNPVLDTMVLARHALPSDPSRSLEALARSYGLPQARRHRALADCEVLAGLVPLVAGDAPEGPACLDRLVRSFPDTAFPPEKAPPGWEYLAEAIREGRVVEVAWKGRDGAGSARLKPLRLLRRWGRPALLGLPKDADPVEIPLRELREVDGRPGPGPGPRVPWIRQELLERVRGGESLGEAAGALDLERGVALRYVCEAILRGEELAWAHLVPAGRVEAVHRALEHRDPAPLRSLKESLPAEVGWEDLHLALAGWHRARGTPLPDWGGS